MVRGGGAWIIWWFYQIASAATGRAYMRYYYEFKVFRFKIASHVSHRMSSATVPPLRFRRGDSDSAQVSWLAWEIQLHAMKFFCDKGRRYSAHSFATSHRTFSVHGAILNRLSIIKYNLVCYALLDFETGVLLRLRQRTRIHY